MSRRPAAAVLPSARLGRRPGVSVQFHGEPLKNFDLHSKTRERKSFISSIFASLAVFALALLMSVILVSNSGFENVQLQSRLVSERVYDAQAFINATQEDALFDQAYQLGCNDVQAYCSGVSARFNSYFNNVKPVLNDSTVTVSLDAQTPTCVFDSENEPEYTFSVNHGFFAVVNSSTSLKTQEMVFSKNGAITVTGGQNGKHVVVSVTETGNHFEYDCPA